MITLTFREDLTKQIFNFMMIELQLNKEIVFGELQEKHWVEEFIIQKSIKII